MTYGILNTPFDNSVPRNNFILPAYGSAAAHALTGRALAVTFTRGVLSTSVALAGDAAAVAASTAIIGYPIPLAGDAVASPIVTGSFETSARLSGIAIVNTIVTGELQNRAPVALTLSDIQFTQGVPESFDLSEYGYDPDGDELTLIFVPGPDGLPAGITFDAFTGILSYDGGDLGATEATPKVWANNRLIFEDRTDFGAFASSQVDAAGTLTSILSLVGSATANVSADGLLSYPYELFGNAVAEATSETSLSTGVMLQGVAAAIAASAGHITNIMQIAGDAVSSCNASGVLYAQVLAIAGNADIVCNASGTLTALVLFEGFAQGEASGLGRLGPDYVLFGDAVVEANATGKLYTMGKDYPWEQEISTLNEWTKEQPL